MPCIRKALNFFEWVYICWSSDPSHLYLYLLRWNYHLLSSAYHSSVHETKEQIRFPSGRLPPWAHVRLILSLQTHPALSTCALLWYVLHIPRLNMCYTSPALRQILHLSICHPPLPLSSMKSCLLPVSPWTLRARLWRSCDPDPQVPPTRLAPSFGNGSSSIWGPMVIFPVCNPYWKESYLSRQSTQPEQRNNILPFSLVL